MCVIFRDTLMEIQKTKLPVYVGQFKLGPADERDVLHKAVACRIQVHTFLPTLILANPEQ